MKVILINNLFFSVWDLLERQINSPEDWQRTVGKYTNSLGPYEYSILFKCYSHELTDSSSLYNLKNILEKEQPFTLTTLEFKYKECYIRRIDKRECTVEIRTHMKRENDTWK